LCRDINLFIAFPRETQGSVRATYKPGMVARFYGADSVSS
jgi:hypothetical protein